MLLTSAQVAQKLGVSRNYVTVLAREGRLKAVRGQHETPSGRTNYSYDPRVVAEFKKTFIPPVPRQPKTLIVNVKTGEVRPGNGHAPDTLPLDIPSAVQLFNYLTATRVELGDRLRTVEAKLDSLLKAWGVSE